MENYEFLTHLLNRYITVNYQYFNRVRFKRLMDELAIQYEYELFSSESEVDIIIIYNTVRYELTFTLDPFEKILKADFRQL